MTPSFVPRLLLGASLLGTSGLALSAGGSQAMTLCGFGNSLSPACAPGVTATLGDKRITIVEFYAPTSTLVSGNVEFFNPPAASANHAVNISFSGDSEFTGNLSYKLEVLDPSKTFSEAKLSWDDRAGFATSIIGKSIYAIEFSSELLGSTAATNGIIGLAGRQTIWVYDSYLSYGGLNSLRNEFSQQGVPPVPAPLPLLGAGAVFGACRRLRRLSDRLPRRTAVGSPSA